MPNSLCGHEERLDDAIHVAGVAQIDQASLPSFRLSTLPQKVRAK